MPKSLEIHHINIKGGDCTVIVLRNDPTKKATTKKILIDGGCVGSGWRRLAGYLEKYFDERPFDYMIASHYHDDHILGLASAGVKFKKFVDIGGYEIKNQTVFSPKRKQVATSALGYFNSYADLVAAQIKENQAQRVKLPFLQKGSSANGPVAITIANDITLTCYCGDGYLADGTDVIGEQDKGVHPATLDENDLSLGFLLTWGDFIYYTVADLSGDETGSYYYNIEGPLVDYLKKGVLKGMTVTVAKASHHGSNHSSYPEYNNKKSKIESFLNSLQPDTIIVPSNIHKGVPGEFYLERAREYCNKTKQKKTILFANDLAYGNTDVQYRPLNQIISDKIDSNLSIDTTDDNRLHNDGPTAIVVQVKEKQSVKNLALGKTATVLKRTGYTLYIDISDLPNVTREPLTVSGVKIISFEDDDGTVLTSIQNGFEAQAKEITNWIESNDQKTQEWLGFMTPSLDISKIVPEVKTNKANAAKMISKQFLDMFNECYKKDGDLYKPAANPSRYKKQTIVNLLQKNPNQVKLNVKAGWVTKANDFYYNAPVETPNDKKRKRDQVVGELSQNPKRSKRIKTKK